MVSRNSRLVLILSFVLIIDCHAQKNIVRTPSLPDWIEKNAPSYTAEYDGADVAGYYYLLIDQQSNLKTKQRYIHTAVKILNNEGVQEMSDLSIIFDPAYQQLTFHQINIIRNNSVIDRLKQQEIRLVQRETNMDRHLYDGRLTAILNLSDIRNGDIIEYAYSVTGENPIYEGKYSDQIYFQFSVPLERQYTRIIVPAARDLLFKYSNAALNPQIEAGDGTRSYVWDIQKIKPLLPDINTPAWYDPYPRVSVSEYISWNNVVEQYAKWYMIEDQDRNDLELEVKKLIGSLPADSVIIKSIRFVQDEIRYLAFEDGLNSHKPDQPLNVLHQRYGDCKAKAFLLSEMLRLYGIDASPVLVSTYKGYVLENELPSPDAFNHCIVQINRNGKAYFIDPTLRNQGGDLEHYYCPDYQKGLVLKNSTHALTDMPFRRYAMTKVTETFTLQETGKGASLFVSTVYIGGDADSQRSTFESTDLESAQKEYVNFYSKLYPNIKATKKIRITDSRETHNEFIVEEYYQIDSLWEKSTEKEQMLLASFYPLSLETYISDKHSPTRIMPYNINYPVNYEHITVLKMPENWNVENDSKKIQDSSFVYEYHVDYSNNTISISHKYRTLSNSITASQVESFVSKHNQIMENLPYVLTYDKSLVNIGFKLSWVAGFTAFLTLIISVLLAVRVYKKHDITVSYDPNFSLQIGSWLILIGFGLIISPIRLLFDLYKSPEYFNSNLWNSLAQVYDPVKGKWLAALMWFELVYNVVLIVYVVFTTVLFFNRRTIFPKAAVILYITVFVIGLLDYLVSIGLNPTAYTEQEKTAFIRAIIQSFVSAAIWVPYLLISDRVKQTFVLRSRLNSLAPDLSVQK